MSEPSNEFPKMLYRIGDEIEWEGRHLATLIVADAEAAKEAISNGWQHLADLLTPKKAKAK
jgi:hypothetical protein